MTPPGAKWITVHPNGPDDEGRPVLIKDDGSGTVLGGMGGTFNGQKLGALYKSGDSLHKAEPAEAHKPEPPKAEPEPEPEPTSTEAHPKYNPHLADYEDFGPELQAEVYGVPRHGGEGRGWRFHLRNPHLAAMSKQGYGALPGGTLGSHPEGGVIYHQRPEVGDPGDYEAALHSMAQDVAGQIHEHLGREHERRMLDEEQKAYQEETERELAAWKRSQMAGVRKAIADFGGIARFDQRDAKGRRYMDAEYDDYVPKWARNQSGLTPDRARAALNAEFPHLGLETPSDLFDYLDQFEDEKAAFREEQAQRGRAKAWAAEERRTARAARTAAAAAREGDSQTMPYDSTDDLPDAAKDKLSAHQQEVFRAAFNNALKDYGDESKAYAVAWAAAKKADEGAGAGTTAREADLTAKRRDDLDEDQFAFPTERKLPIHDAAHVRNAIARFNQTQGMDPAEKKAAWARIKRAAKRHGVEMADDEDDGSTSREAMTDAQRERPVRETVAHTAHEVRTKIVREGRGYRIRGCQIMAAGSGNALQGNTYLPAAVEALVREVQRQPKSYVDHSLPSEVRERGHRSLRDLAGVYDKRTVRYDPTSQACLADLIVRPSVYDEYVAPVLEAGDNLGISVDGIGHCPDRPRHVTGWKRFNSADLVPAGGARGFIVREANSAAEKAAERDFSMAVLDDITATDVRETAPALYEEIGRHYQAAHPATGTPSAGPPPSPVPPADDGRLNALESRVREAEQRAEAADARVYELEAERNRAAVAAFVDATVRECGIAEDKQAAFVAKRFGGATMGAEGTYPDQETLEAAVREAAEEFKAVLPTTPTGQIVGLGSGTGGSGHGSKFTAPSQAQNKAILTATDWLFGARSVPSASGVAATVVAGNGQGS